MFYRHRKCRRPVIVLGSASHVFLLFLVSFPHKDFLAVTGGNCGKGCATRREGRAKAGFVVFIDKTLADTKRRDVVTVNMDVAFISIKSGSKRYHHLHLHIRVSFVIVSNANT
jgi:hypothetical protein